MIKEVLVVEGKMDVVAIDKAVEADCIITEGFNLKPQALKNIEQAYKKRGIIIMTDPDSAGERIRKYLSRRFPEAKHAFVPVEEATANDDIGIEQAGLGAQEDVHGCRSHPPRPLGRCGCFGAPRAPRRETRARLCQRQDILDAPQPLRRHERGI